MAAEGRRSYFVPSHLAVTADVAPHVLYLLRDGRAWARTNQVTLSPAVVGWLADLEALVASTRGAVEPAAEVVAVRWVSTARAAEMLGLAERTVRTMKRQLRSRVVAGRMEFDEADVMAEAEARAEYRRPAA